VCVCVPMYPYVCMRMCLAACHAPYAQACPRSALACEGGAHEHRSAHIPSPGNPCASIHLAGMFPARQDGWPSRSQERLGRHLACSRRVACLMLCGCRWNTAFADDYGVHLNFLAMLVGFLTYKVAILGKQAKELADELSPQAKQNQQQQQQQQQ